MREIKFRAADKDGKVYPVTEMHLTFENGASVHMKGRHYEGDKHLTVVKFERLMQYTGLKDKNGKEIYEGDILLCGDSGEFFSQDYDEEKDEYVNTHKAKVIGPTDSYPAFDIDPNPCEETNGLSQLMATGEMEVIGNIHENAELLKDEEV